MSADPSIPWDASDAVGLRAFLSQHPSVMQYLVQQRGSIKTGNLEETAMSGAEMAGYERCLKNLRAMMTEKASGDDNRPVNVEQD